MPKTETTLTVFVASPSDVKEERARLDDVINEVNLTRSPELGVRLELVKWETHAFPGFGPDPQKVVNAAIPADYDIFIGMMWHRFGTPTLDAASGTMEEYQSAKKRFDNDPSSVRIMMYFKDAPVPFSQIDPDQIRAVADFKRTLESQGLYSTFEDTDHFEKLVRIHLQKAIQDWGENGFTSTMQLPAPSKSAAVESEGSLDEPGLLDLTIEFSERFTQASVHMQNSNSIMNAATERINGLAAEMASFGGVTSQNIKKAKQLADGVAHVLLSFNTDFGKAASLAADNIEAGIDAMIRFVELQNAVPSEEEDKVITLIQSMDDAQNHIEGYRDKIIEVLAIVATMPPVTGEVNRAKRRLLITLNSVVDRQNKSVELIKELKKTLFSVLNNNTAKV